MEMEDRKIWAAQEGVAIFKQGEPVKFVGLILEGTVRIEAKGNFYTVGPGDVLGFPGIREGAYSDICKSETAVKLCPFQINGENPLEKLFLCDSKTISMMLHSLAGQVCKRMNQYGKLYEESGSIYRILSGAYRKYQEHAGKITGQKLDVLDKNNLEPLYEEYEADKDTMLYYSELGTVSLDEFQKFAGERPAVAKSLAENMLDFIKDLEHGWEELLRICRDNFEQIVSEEKDCLMLKYFRLYKKGVETGRDLSFLKLQMDYLLQTLVDIQKRNEEERGISFGYSIERWKETLKLYKGRKQIAVEEAEEVSDEVIRGLVEKELRDSMSRLLIYSNVKQERQEIFQGAWQEYQKLRGTNVEEDQIRRLLRQIEDIYYEVYEGVFCRAEEEKNQSLLILLFLNFGFMDEKIFQDKDLISLYRCQQQLEKSSDSIYHIYSIRQWLQLIYKGIKEPSKNEFDMDYKEVFLDMKRTKKFTPEEEAAYFADQKGKLKFEIKNMFRKNNRQIFGQVGFFCPILTGEQLLQGIEGNFLSHCEIEDGMEEIRKIDYSVFYRETLYQNDEKKIDRAQIMVEVLPDIILMPCVGIRGSMWQDIEGKRRVSAGRFILPIFLCADISEILLKMVGKFRWELCRTIQGGYWNNLAEKSLTSEYYDYLQFYKKNRDLNDQVKQKIRDKIKQFRNNFSDLFINDYVQWIRYESRGASKLNKVSRDILLRYCPFSKEYRNALEGNPMFYDAVSLWDRKKELKVKAIQNQLLHLEKTGAEITQELKDTLDFYLM